MNKNVVLLAAIAPDCASTYGYKTFCRYWLISAAALLPALSVVIGFN
jgi:hypothetical protein